MEIYFIFTIILAVLMLAVLVSIAVRIGSASEELREVKSEIIKLRHDFELTKNELNEEYQYRLKDILDDIKESNGFLNNINEIMNIIEKYELPDLQKRKILDKIKMDEEFSNKLDEAHARKT